MFPCHEPVGNRDHPGRCRQRAATTGLWQRCVPGWAVMGLLVAMLGAVPSALAQPVLSVNGLNANYTTTHVFVDEVAGTSVPLTILFQPNAANLTAIEVFSNLNRRDRAVVDADGDGVQDGIRPPSGNLVVAGSDAHYFKAYPMTDLGGGQFSLTLLASNTGAYRLTARYKVQGNTNWIYYNEFDGSPGVRQRDHAIVVSPVTARDMRFYELNALTVEAEGTLESQRSTFADLHDGPGATRTPRWNLTYITNLGVNWLWFQPIHPYGEEGRHLSAADINARGPGPCAFTTWRWNGGPPSVPSEDVNYPYALGSPYAVKNFWEVEPRMSKGVSRAAAMGEFTNFVVAADAANVSVMLDAAFNHTAWDVELGELGRDLFAPWTNATAQIRQVEARFFSRTDDYYQRAYDAGSVAPAPDRYDFGKWLDAKDVFFGRYAALWQNSGSLGKQTDEGDWFDYSTSTGNFDSYTHKVWRYFAEYAIYWMDKTGHPVGTPKNQSHKGIDGLRCDFGQGLPPQAWEYIINRCRSVKWNFVWMSESLDGGAVTYRSNRHFDVLNEDLVFALKGAGNTSAYRTAFDNRRNWYGQGLMLLNTTSHDEQNFSDPWQALIRFGVASTIDGAPMIFQGQELGLSDFFGFDLMEKNLCKYVPHFKTWNSMMPLWADADFGNDQLYPVFSGINKAREASAALRSSNRWFLNQTSDTIQENLFSVAKYETATAPPNFADVVFAFMNLDRNNVQSGTFNVNISAGGSNLFGIKSGRTYNIKNLAAYTAANPNRRTDWVWTTSRTGADLLANGIVVILNKVPTTVADWTTAPFEAQYLKLYDVTPPPAMTAPTSPQPYAIGATALFSWAAATDPEGGISGYRLLVGTAPGDSNVFNGLVTGTSQIVTGALGQTLYATVIALNNAGIAGPASPSSAGVLLLDPAVDNDGDGMSNGSEGVAGTNPLNPNSLLRILNLGAGGALLTWSSEPGKTYQVQATTNLSQPFAEWSGVLPSGGYQTTYTNPAPDAHALLYRVVVLP
jgi:glycosidase